MWRAASLNTHPKRQLLRAPRGAHARTSVQLGNQKIAQTRIVGQADGALQRGLPTGRVSQAEHMGARHPVGRVAGGLGRQCVQQRQGCVGLAGFGHGHRLADARAQRGVVLHQHAIKVVDDTRQVKRRRNAARQGFVFDYGEFWASQGGRQAQIDVNWTLPLQPARKPLEAVPSHKRSEYRKRHALLDDLQARVADALGDSPSPTANDAGMRPGQNRRLLGLSARRGIPSAPLARLWLIGSTPELADWALHLAA